MDKMNLFLQPDEQRFLALAVIDSLEELNLSLKDSRINWTPESRKTIKEMIEAGEKLKAKLTKLGFDMRPLPDLEEGEENDYLTKQS